jgi:ribosomal protein L37AE/L43A
MKVSELKAECQPPAESDPLCAGCGGRLRYRGRRGSTTIWACDDSDCPVVLSELHEPCLETPQRRGGR